MGFFQGLKMVVIKLTFFLMFTLFFPFLVKFEAHLVLFLLSPSWSSSHVFFLFSLSWCSPQSSSFFVNSCCTSCIFLPCWKLLHNVVYFFSWSFVVVCCVFLFLIWSCFSPSCFSPFYYSLSFPLIALLSSFSLFLVLTMFFSSRFH